MDLPALKKLRVHEDNGSVLDPEEEEVDQCQGPSTRSEASVDLMDSASQMETQPEARNVFGCHGVWAENVSEYSKKYLMRLHFAKFGNVTSIEQVKHRGLLLVDFDNEQSPIQAIAVLSAYEKIEHVLPADQTQPIRFHFRPTAGQNRRGPEGNFDLAGECLEWRTRGCNSGPACSGLHLPHCEAIDLQPTLPEPRRGGRRR